MNDKPKTQEELDDAAYPATEYTKKTFSFSKEELTDLQPFEEVIKLINTLIVVGGITQKAKENYVVNQVLPRLDIKSSADSKFSYDLNKNKVIAYEPRYWCSVCNNRKAEFKYEDKTYCKVCIEAKKQEVAKPIEKESEPKKKS